MYSTLSTNKIVREQKRHSKRYKRTWRRSEKDSRVEREINHFRWILRRVEVFRMNTRMKFGRTISIIRRRSYTHRTHRWNSDHVLGNRGPTICVINMPTFRYMDLVFARQIRTICVFSSETRVTKVETSICLNKMSRYSNCQQFVHLRIRSNFVNTNRVLSWTVCDH